MEPKTGRLRVPSNLRIRVEGGSTEQLHPTVSLLGQWLSQKDASIQWQATRLSCNPARPQRPIDWKFDPMA